MRVLIRRPESFRPWIRDGKIRIRDNQCCGSGMFIPDPGSWFLPIPDPGSKNSNKRERLKKICCHTFLCSHKFHKIVNYFSFEVLWANFQFSKNYRTFYQKNCQKALKNVVLGSGIRKKPIPDPGSRGQKAPDPGSGSATLGITIPDSQHWVRYWVPVLIGK